MTPSDAEAWARLRLVQGRANAQLWELVQSAGQSTLTVGANAGCTWPVADAGVAPIHFTLHWDGKHLHAADTYGAGDVRVDGEPLDRHFRVLTGRSRIDFGHAAIVVETSIHNPAEPAHPLDPGPLPAPAAGVSRSSPPRSHAHQTTLLGVSPLAGVPLRGVVVGQPESDQASASSRPPQGSAPKGTLMGMTPVPEKAAVAATSSAPGAGQNGVRSARGMGATLMGVGADVVAAAVAHARAATAANAALSEADQRTVQGFPGDGQRVSPPASNHTAGRRDTQQGLYSAAPGVAFEAVKEARVKSISGTPSPLPAGPSAQHSSTVVTREGRTTWEEIPSELGRTRESGPTYAAVPVSADVLHQAVLVDSLQDAATEPAHPPGASYGAADDTWRQPRSTRFSDAPTEMRDVTPFESKRPSRPIPWQYVGLGMLTAIAYIAWLYLLDHF